MPASSSNRSGKHQHTSDRSEGGRSITELENLMLAPAVDAERIAGLKAGIPKIDVYMEYTGEKPLPRVNKVSRTDWSIGRLNEKFKELMGRPI